MTNKASSKQVIQVIRDNSNWYKPDEWKNKITRPDMHLLSQPRR